MRNFELTVRTYWRDGEFCCTRVLGFAARNMNEAKKLASKEVLRQTGDNLPWDDLRDVTEEE
jgi:hypothetical protein